MSENVKTAPDIRFKGYTDAWEQRKLGEVTTKIGSGKTPKGGAAVYLSAGVPLLRSQNIVNNMVDVSDVVYISESTNIEMSNSRVRENDVLLNITGASIGRSAVYRLSTSANVNQHVCIIRSQQEANADFIQLNLTSPNGQKQVENNQAGGGREGLNFQQIAKVSFGFPSLAEQTAIGAFSRTLDTAITLHQRKLDALRELKKGYLQQMFPQAGERVPRVRFVGFSGEWEERRLGEVAEITMGQAPDSANYTSNPSDHILVQGNADMKDGKVVPRVWTTQITKMAFEDDIIISVRAPVGSVGRTKYNIVLGRGVAGIRGNEFIYQMLTQMNAFGYWGNIIQGSTFESINSNDLKEAIVNVPCKKIQTIIGNFFRALDDQIIAQQAKLTQMEQLKTAFLQKMFI